MNILHLLSNRKWTERAEPAVDLALAQRALGLNVRFACGRWTLAEGEERSVAVHAARKGLEPTVLELPKHFGLRAALKDIPALRDLMNRDRVDILHTHMENAHLLAALARRRSTRAARIVNQSYDAEGPAPGVRAGLLHRGHTDGLIVLSEHARAVAGKRFGFPAGRMAVIEPGIDTNFFDPGRPVADARASWGLGEGDVVLGMVTRIRKDRRPDLAVEVVHRLLPEMPALRLLLVGRGEELENLRARARDLGIGHAVVTPGYLAGDALLAAYRAMDALFYPVPGTDQSCRTVREAMAMGLPVLAGSTGFLNELVTGGETGWFTGPTLEDTAAAVARLADRQSVQRAGRAARARALERFSLETQARRTVAFYRALLA